MMRKATLRTSIALFVALIGLVAGRRILSQPERLLLQRATKVPLPGGVHRQYWWLPHDRMLLSRDASRPGMHPHDRDFIIVTFYLYELTTRTEKPLRKLSHLFNKSTLCHWLGSVSPVSPDGKWVLWEDTIIEKQENFIYMSAIDGSHHFYWRVRNDCDPVLWLPDSSGVVSIDLDPDGDTAEICSVRPPHTAKEFPFNIAETMKLSNVDRYFLASKDRLLVREHTDQQNLLMDFLERHAERLIPVLSRIDRVYLHGQLHLAYPEDNDKPISRVEIAETTLQRKPPRSRKFTIHLPTGARLR